MGARALASALRESGPRRPLVGCLAILDDKDQEAMLRTLAGLVDRLVLTACSHPRSLPAQRLAETAGSLGLKAEAVDGPHEALARARELAGEEGTVVAAGSLYLIADLGRPSGDEGGSTL